MKFKAPILEAQFRGRLHQRVQDLARRFDRFCIGMNFDHAIVTDISREPEFYEDNALEKPPFSWHLVDCAIDFRNHHLPRSDQETCEEWLMHECQGSEWELVFRYHGTGPHWHVAFRDFTRRKGFIFPNPRPPPVESK